MRPEVFDLIERLKQAHFDGAVLLGFGERTAVVHGPFLYSPVREKDAHGKCGLAVGSHIEHKFGGSFLGSSLQSRASTDKIVLIDVPFSTGVSLHATDGHKDPVDRTRSSLEAGLRPKRTAHGCYSILASRSRLTAVSEARGE